MKCRGCGKTNLKTFLDLGKIPLVDKFKSKRELVQKEKHFPLDPSLLLVCCVGKLIYPPFPSVWYIRWSIDLQVQ